MKEIKLKISSNPKNKEWAVANAIDRLTTRLCKEYDVSIHQGQGGSLDDWEEPDLKYREGLLYLIRISDTKLQKSDNIK